MIGSLTQTSKREFSHTNIKEGVHDRLSHTNIKEGVHDRPSHTNKTSKRGSMIGSLSHTARRGTGYLSSVIRVIRVRVERYDRVQGTWTALAPMLAEALGAEKSDTFRTIKYCNKMYIDNITYLYACK